MDIICLNRIEIETQSFDTPHIMIVIYDPDLNKPNITLSDHCLDTLYLSFDDISYESDVDILFNDKDAFGHSRYKHISCQTTPKPLPKISKVAVKDLM